MSEYQHQRGKLMEFKRSSTESKEDFFKRAMGNLFKQEAFNQYILDNDMFDFLDECNCYEKIFYINENFYKVLEIEEIDPNYEVQVLNKNLDDTYTFEMKYYNGGTCLEEMIQESLEKLKK